jgi:DNA polymerase V
MKVIKSTISAGIVGFESPAAEYSSRPLLLDDVLIERRAATFIAVASGDSMTGLGIFSGDLLIVDRAAAKRDLDIVVAVINGELVCKQVDRSRGLLLSANRNYKPVLITECDEYLEEGIVIRSVRLFRQPSAIARYFE